MANKEIRTIMAALTEGHVLLAIGRTGLAWLAGTGDRLPAVDRRPGRKCCDKQGAYFDY